MQCPCDGAALPNLSDDVQRIEEDSMIAITEGLHPFATVLPFAIVPICRDSCHRPAGQPVGRRGSKMVVTSDSTTSSR